MSRQTIQTSKHIADVKSTGWAVLRKINSQCNASSKSLVEQAVHSKLVLRARYIVLMGRIVKGLSESVLSDFTK